VSNRFQGSVSVERSLVTRGHQKLLSLLDTAKSWPVLGAVRSGALGWEWVKEA
jgi:hypothetical protein